MHMCRYVCVPTVCNTCGGQKRALDPRDWSYRGCELPCWCYDWNLGTLQEQLVLLGSEPISLALGTT